jgi:hypothetical protein
MLGQQSSWWNVKNVIRTIGEVCEKQGGADIGNGYVVVNTKFYNVTQKVGTHERIEDETNM